jgi:hypothetical protein
MPNPFHSYLPPPLELQYDPVPATSPPARQARCSYSVKRVIDFPVPHKVRTYKEYHSVCPSSELGLSQPLSLQRVFPSPQKTGGRWHTSLRVGGWGGVPIPTRGIHPYTMVLFICTYFVLSPNLPSYTDSSPVSEVRYYIGQLGLHDVLLYVKYVSLARYAKNVTHLTSNSLK